MEMERAQRQSEEKGRRSSTSRILICFAGYLEARYRYPSILLRTVETRALSAFNPCSRVRYTCNFTSPPLHSISFFLYVHPSLFVGYRTMFALLPLQHRLHDASYYLESFLLS